MRKLRTEFLSGNIKTCRKKIKHLACHERFRHFAGVGNLAEVMATPPVRLDVRLNGQCNLSCVMCEVWQEPNGVYNSGDFWEKGPLQIFPYLRELDVLGGEPFIQRDTYRLIREVSQVNRECEWSFVTNGQYSFRPRVHAALAALKIKMFQVSVDSLVKTTYETIRRKGRFERLMSTVDDVCLYREEREREGRPFTLRLSMCVLRENWREVPAFLEFCRERRAEPDLQFAFYDPSGSSSLNWLTPVEKRAVLDYWVEHVPPAAAAYVHPVASPLAAALAKEERP